MRPPLPTKRCLQRDHSSPFAQSWRPEKWSFSASKCWPQEASQLVLKSKALRLQMNPFSRHFAFPGVVGKLGEPKTAKGLLKCHNEDTLARSTPLLHNCKRGTSPAEKGKRSGRGCGLGWLLLWVLASKRIIRQENARAQSPNPLNNPQGSPITTIKKARGPDSEPPFPAAWQPRRECGSLAPSRRTKQMWG